MKHLFAFLLLVAPTAAPVRGADDGTGPDSAEVKAVRDKAIAFLRTKQAEDGSFSKRVAGPGVTALAVAALLRNGLDEKDPTVAKALAYLEKSVKPDGGVYEKRLANYTTCVAMMAFAEANAGGKYDAVLKKATAYLRKLQYEDGAGSGVNAGGVGYDGNKGRADMSNTQYFVDALLAAGVPKTDPAVQDALKFVNRCQNLPGETNDQPFAKKAKADDKGGLTYVPDPDDKAHATGDGGLRSLGAMTYAGLKSFLYAGVKKDDPRVVAALDWVRRHYTLEENPGMKQSGLFYYYNTFGKAMAALGESRFEDSKGVKHDWRKELFVALQKRQGKDGGFRNDTDRAFGEQDPALATTFALLALSYVTPPK